MINNYILKYLKYLVDLNCISEENIPEYEYELLRMTESIIVIVAMLIVGALFHCIIYCMVFMICFFLIRNRTGGFHLETFFQCFIGTIVLEIIGIYFINRWQVKLCLVFDILTLLNYIFIMFLGALNHPNMNFTKEEYRNTKKMARFMVTLIFALILFLKWVEASTEVILFMEYAVSLSGILLLLGKVTGQHKK